MRRLRKWNNRVFAGLLAAMVTAGSLQSALYPVMPVYAAEQEPEEAKEIVTEEKEEEKTEEQTDELDDETSGKEKTFEFVEDADEQIQTVTLQADDLLSIQKDLPAEDVQGRLGAQLNAVNDEQGADQSVQTLEANLVSGAEKEGNKYIWSPTKQESGHSFIFRVNFSTTGEHDIEAGKLQITIPKHILKQKSGEYADEYEMSVPTKTVGEIVEQYAVDLVYEELDDVIVITNERKLPAATNNYFEVTYKTTKPTYEYWDMGSVDSEGNAVDASDPFTVKVEILGAKSDPKDSSTASIYIDTKAKLTKTTKNLPEMYMTWSDAWGNKPSDADDYYYLAWEIATEIGTVTQRYDFSLSDEILTPNDQTGEVVGFIMSGSSNKTVYLPTGQSGSELYSEELKGLTKTGTRYDVVITRHKKEQFPTEPGITYKIENKIKATVKPADHVDEEPPVSHTRIYEYTKPKFGSQSPNVTLIKYGTENWDKYYPYRWECASYELGELADQSISHISGLRYTIQMKAYPGEWTVKEGESTTDHANYGGNPVIYELTDDTLYLLPKGSTYFSSTSQIEADREAAKDLKLDLTDYDFDYLDYSIRVKDSEFNDVKQTFDEKDHEYTETDVISWYIKDDQGEWGNAGTYNLKTGAAEITDQNHISSLGSSHITFREGVKGVRATVSNASYSTVLTVTPSLRLMATEHVSALCQSNNTTMDEVILKNEADVKVSDETHEETPLREGVALSGDRIRKTTRTSSITKNMVNSWNDTRRKSFVINWKVNVSEEQTSKDNSTEKVLQQSGTFYDLLPKGASLQHGSIEVSAAMTDGAQEEVLPAAEYSVTEKLNYKGSGRTLVVVNIAQSAYKYSLSYNTLHSWDSLKDYGQDIVNPVAYETGNADIANGYPDDGGKLSTDKQLMSNLDTDDQSGAKKFIYAEKNQHITNITAALSGLDKKTISVGDDDWSYETTVEQGGTYEYRLRYANSAGITTSNMVFYDSLESFKKGSAESQWKGKLLSIDVSQMVQQGAAPIVYVSNSDSVSKSSYFDSVEDAEGKMVPPAITTLEEPIWVTEEEYLAQHDDFSEVTAVAIDVSKKKDGTNFTLENDQTVTIILRMKAPEEVTGTADGDSVYPETYNNVYMKDTLYTNGTTTDYYLYQTNTTVRYHVTGRFVVHKISSTNPNTVIQGVTFRITGRTSYGKEVDITSATNAKGNATFDGLEAGDYILQEGQGVADYLEDHTEHVLKVSESGTVNIDGEDLVGSNYTVENRPRVHGDFVFYKRNPYEDQKSLQSRVSGAKFMLSGTSEYGNQVAMVATSQSSGDVIFRNVEMGSYQLTETAPADGYMPLSTVYTATIDQNGNAAITYEDENHETQRAKTDAAGNILVYNEPLVDLEIWKVDGTQISETSGEYTAPLKGAEFTLSGVTTTGKVIELKSVSEASGKTPFEDLEPGKYYLRETKAPTNGDQKYKLDTNRYEVIVEKGAATIKTTDVVKFKTKNAFYFENKPATAEVVVTKKWVQEDGGSPEFIKENLPKIHISVEEPEKKTSTDAKAWRKAWEVLRNNFGPLEVKAAEVFEHNHTEVKGTGTLNNNASATWTCYGDGCLIIRPTTAGSEVTLGENNNLKNKSFGGDVKRISYEPGTGKFYVSKTLNMYAGAYGVETIDISGLDFSKCTDLSFMFTERSSGKYDPAYSLTSLKEILGLEKLGAARPTSTSNMFGGCKSLASIDLSMMDMSAVTTTEKMFADCQSLASIKGIESWSFEKVNTFQDMFWNCLSIESLDLRGWNTASVTNMTAMFSLDSAYMDRTKLKYVNISGWTANNGVTTLTSNMFNRQIKLKEIVLGKDFVFDKPPYNSLEISGWPPNDETYSGGWSLDSPYSTDDPVSTSRIFPTTATAARDADWVWQYKSGARAGQNFESSDNMEPLTDGKIGEGYWEQDQTDPSIWRYTFIVNNPDVTWYVWEEDVAEFVSDHPQNDPLIVNLDEREAVITNTDSNLNARGYGDLSISKAVEIDPLGIQEDEEDPAFSFDITLTNSGMIGLSGFRDLEYKKTDKNGVSTEGVTQFIDGVAHISLKAGDKVIYSHLLSGTEYLIKEGAEPEFYTIKTGKEGVEGTIASDSESEASITNYFSKPKPVEKDKRDIVLQKVVTDPEHSDGKYPFVITLFNLEPETTYQYVLNDEEEPKEFVTNEIGYAEIVTSEEDGNLLGNDDQLVLKDVPEGAQYQIREIGGMYTTTFEIEDKNDLGLINVPKGASAVENADLSTALERMDAGEEITIIFRNTPIIRIVQTLTIKKQVTGLGDPSGMKFPIRIEMTTPEPDQEIKINGQAVRSDGAGSIDSTYEIEHGDGHSIDISDIPVGTKYKITELPNSMKASYIITEVDDEGADIPLADNRGENTEANMSLSTSVDADIKDGRKDRNWREVVENRNDTVEFTNIAPEKGVLILKKTVDGNMGDRKRRFEFSIDLSETLRDAIDESKTYEHPMDGTFYVIRTTDNINARFGDFVVHNTSELVVLQETFGEDAVETISFVAGRSYVDVGHSEQLVILGIPSGVKYRVQEKDYSTEGYALSEIIVHDKENINGEKIENPTSEQRVITGVIEPVNYESSEPMNFDEFTNSRSLSIATGVHTDRFPLVLPSIGLIGMLVSLLMLLKGRTLL